MWVRCSLHCVPRQIALMVSCQAIHLVIMVASTVKLAKQVYYCNVLLVNLCNKVYVGDGMMNVTINS